MVRRLTWTIDSTVHILSGGTAHRDCSRPTSARPRSRDCSRPTSARPHSRDRSRPTSARPRSGPYRSKSPMSRQISGASRQIALEDSFIGNDPGDLPGSTHGGDWGGDFVDDPELLFDPQLASDP